MNYSYTEAKWSVKDIVENMYVESEDREKNPDMKKENKQFIFDNAVQRTLCWDRVRESKLIRNMLLGMPIPHMLVLDGDQKDFIDGKQRCHSLYFFMDDRFKLKLPKNLQYIKGKNGKMIDLNGMTWADLPEDMKHDLLTYTLYAVQLDRNTTPEQVEEIFDGWNSGKPLSPIELNRNALKVRTRKNISTIAEGHFFEKVMNDADRSKYKNVDAVIRAWIQFYAEDEKKGFTNAKMMKIIPDMVIGKEQKAELLAVFDKMFDICCYLDQYGHPYKNIFKITHMLTIAEVVRYDLEKPKGKQAEAEDMALWLGHFFAHANAKGSKKGISINASYNESTVQGSGSIDSINNRFRILCNSYKEHFEKGAPLSPIVKQDDEPKEKTDGGTDGNIDKEDTPPTTTPKRSKKTTKDDSDNKKGKGKATAKHGKRKAQDGAEGQETQEPPQDGAAGQETQETSQDGAEGQETQEPPQDGAAGQETQETSQDGAEGQETQEPPQDGAEGQETQEPPQDGAEGQETQEPPQDGAEGSMMLEGFLDILE